MDREAATRQLSELLRQLQRESECTWDQLAEAAHMSRSSVRNYLGASLRRRDRRTLERMLDAMTASPQQRETVRQLYPLTLDNAASAPVRDVARARLMGSVSTPRHQPPPYWATIQEIRARTPQLAAARQLELRELVKFSTGPPGYRWIRGPEFSGKTALLAECVTASLPDNVYTVAYFVSRREADADLQHFLDAVVPQLASLLGVESPERALHQFRAMWERVVKLAILEDRHLLLVVDGLDEELRPPGAMSISAALPFRCASGAHILVSSRSSFEPPSDVPVGHPLLTIAPTPLEPFSGWADLRRLATQEIDNFVRRDVDGFMVSVLGVLVAAAGPLAAEDIAHLAGRRRLVTPGQLNAVRQFLLFDAARSIQASGETQSRRFSFAHESLLASARSSEQLCAPEYRLRIHSWAEVWRAAGWPVPDPDLADSSQVATPRYLLEVYPSTLYGEPGRLLSIATDIGWICAAVVDVGVEAVLVVLKAARSLRPSNTDLESVYSAVSGQAKHLRNPEDIRGNGFVERQLCLHAVHLRNGDIVTALHQRLLASGTRWLEPTWSTRQANPAFVATIGTYKKEIRALAALSDGRVVTGTQGGRVLMWDPARPGSDPIVLGSHKNFVQAAASLPDGRVVTGAADGCLKVWDPSKPGADPTALGAFDYRGRWAAHHGWIYAVATLQDGRVVSGGDDRRIRIWDPDAPDMPPINLGAEADWVRAMAVLPDGRVVSVCEYRVRVWDPAQPDASPLDLGAASRRMWAAAVLSDGRIVTAGHGHLRIWDPRNPTNPTIDIDVGDDWVHGVAALPDGCFATGHGSGQVLWWNPDRLDNGPLDLGAHDREIKAIAVLPDGSVVTIGDDRQLRVWDPSVLGGRRVESSAPGREVEALAVLPDGRVFTGGSYDCLRIWDPSSPGSAPLEFAAYSQLSAVAVLPDGRVAAGMEESVTIWNPADLEMYPTYLGHHGDLGRQGRVNAVGVLPDGRVVSGGNDRWVRVWDSNHHGLHRVVPVGSPLPRAGSDEELSKTFIGLHDAPISALAVLSDGRVISGSYDGQIRLWDLTMPHCGQLDPRSFVGSHDGPVRAMTALVDGRFVTGGDDSRVRLWYPKRERFESFDLGFHDDSVTAAAALGDGLVVTGGADRRLRVWDVESRRLTEQVNCSVIALAVGESATGLTVTVVAHDGGGITVFTAPAVG